MYSFKILIIVCVNVVISARKGNALQEFLPKTRPYGPILDYNQRVYIKNDAIPLKENGDNRITSNNRPVTTDDKPVPIPLRFDWRKHGKISPVKNQYECKAGWAFSAIANIESRLRIQWGKIETFSEQYLIDCLEESTGCSHASVSRTFENLMQSHRRVLSDKDYFPYADRQLSCKLNQTLHNKPISVSNYTQIKPDEDLMVEYLLKVGPLSADSKETKVYTPFWIIKNSWGTQWGDNGYYYLMRGKNACGIAMDVSIPSVKII